MRAAKQNGSGRESLLLAVGLLLAGIATGCGTPGAPQPPSLNLPQAVTNLTATRTGNAVTLAWTMPRKSTDNLLLKGDISASLCRGESVGDCQPVGGDLHFAPGTDAHFTETLPVPLTIGEPRAMRYFVELKNRRGRSAGLSNAALFLAGEAPAPVVGLSAETRREGVVLHWDEAQATATVRLHRKLLTAEPKAKSQQGLLAPPPEPIEQSLLVDSCVANREGGCGTLDKTIRLGESYEYRAQRVVRVILDGKRIELGGEISAPIRVNALDQFPPAVPKELEAVASLPGIGNAEAAIDLNWQPVNDANLAGYAVYRCEGREGNWLRLSSAQPIPAAAFHDTQIQAGHRYRYAVTAIARNGHESARSTEAVESVPNP